MFKKNKIELNALIKAEIPIYLKAINLSLLISILVLAPSVFMLQVYDRVINSRSTVTLISMLVLVLGIYILMELLEMFRNRLLQQAAWSFDTNLREHLHDAVFHLSLSNGLSSGQPFNDLKTLRDFISSPAVTAVMDAPTSLIFLTLLALINPWLFWLAVFGAVIQILIGYANEKKTMPALTEAIQASMGAQNYANGVLRNAQVILAMGMKSGMYQRWIERQHNFLKFQAIASDTAGKNAAISKMIQSLQGSLILGLACWLSVKGMLLGGPCMAIVASVIGARVLTPIVQLISQWRLVVNARDAYKRLNSFIENLPMTQEHMPLPAPKGVLSIESIIANAPGSNQVILKGVSFSLQPGDVLLLIGPSAAGKTSLARVLMGIWPVSGGKVRLDGADLQKWNKDELGVHLGYLPQTVELFDGTVSENIARFSDIDMKKVRSATELVGMTALIESLPNGFDTTIGENGSLFSGGQRQRLGLARALYGEPSFVLLDEPNSNLDEAGEQALLKTILNLKERQCTTIIISHRSIMLGVADKILMLRDGQVAKFGPRDEVLNALRHPSGAQIEQLPKSVGSSHPK